MAAVAEVDDNELGSATEGTKPSSAVAAKPAKVAKAQAAKAKAKTAASASAVSHVDRERALGNNRGPRFHLRRINGLHWRQPSYCAPAGPAGRATAAASPVYSYR